MKQENGQEKKTELSKDKQNYLIRRSLVEFFLFAVIFSCAAVQSFQIGEFGVAVAFAAVVTLIEILCEWNAMRRYNVQFPKIDIKATWKQDLALFLGIWVFFAAVFYFFEGKPPITAGFLLGAILGCGVCAAAALYLRKTSMKIE